MTKQRHTDKLAGEINLNQTCLPKARIVSADPSMGHREVEWPVISVPEDVAFDAAFLKRDILLSQVDDRGMGVIREGRSINPVPRDDARRWFEGYIAGSFVSGDEVRPTTVGLPLRGLEELNLFEMRGKQEYLGYMPAYPFHVEDRAETIVVPILGDVWGEKGVITPDLEAAGVLTRVKHEGNPVTVPAYVRTMRQATILTSGRISLLKVGDREIMPSSEEAVEEAWDLVIPSAGPRYLRQLVDMTMQQAYANQGRQGPFEEFDRTNRRHMTILLGSNLRVLNEIRSNLAAKIRENPQFVLPDGVESQNLTPDAVEILVASAVREDLELGFASKPICAVGIKGPGCEHYDGHHILTEHLTKGETPDYIKLSREHPRGNLSFVYDSRFARPEEDFFPRGIMSSIRHQETGSLLSPVGGNSVVDLLIFDEENLYLKHGVPLSVLTTAVVPFLSKEQVPDLVCPQIAIVTTVTVDDTRRISEWIPGELEHPEEADLTREGCRQAYPALVVEKYGGPIVDDESLMRVVSERFDECRDKHWRVLCGKLSQVFNGAFSASRTNPQDQNLGENLSIEGGLADALNMCPMRDPEEFHSLIYHALFQVSQLYETAGFSQTDFFTSEHFRRLCNSTIRGDRVEPLLTEIAESMAEAEAVTVAKVTKAIGLYTDAFLETRGVDRPSVWKMSDAQFLDFIGADDELMDRLKFPKQHLDNFKRASQTGETVYSAGENQVFTPIKLSVELDRHRCNADLRVRLEKAMTIKQRDEFWAQQFRERFGDEII